MHLNQPDRQICGGAFGGWGRRLGRTPLGEPAVQRQGGPAWADREVQGEHDVDLVKPEEGRRHAIGEGDGGQEREYGSHAGEETDGKESKDDHRAGVYRPDPAVADQVPKGPGVLTCLDAFHERWCEPARRGEEITKSKTPDGMGVDEHQARHDPDQAEQGRVGGRVPEPVPIGGHRLCRLLEIADDVVRQSVHLKTPKSELS